LKDYQKKYQKDNPEKYRADLLKSRYGPYSRPMPEVCEICGKPETAKHKTSEKIKVLSFDHNHDSGKFRGWLCQKCNIGLGNFNDSVEILELAIKYLTINKERAILGL
jgi:hypothetical protein